LLEYKEHTFQEVHDFVFDRIGCAHLHITMQNIVNNNKNLLVREKRKIPLQYLAFQCLFQILHQCITLTWNNSNTLILLFNLYEANQNSNHVHELNFVHYMCYFISTNWWESHFLCCFDQY